MGNYDFTCKGGVYHLSNLFVQFYLVYGMNILCQNFKVNLLEI